MSISPEKSANSAYYRKMLYLLPKERVLRAEIATETELALIALLNYMELEYRKSLDDFLRNYGDFSDRLNVIYNRADEMAFDNKSLRSQRFSEVQRENFSRLLPVTLARLEKAEELRDLGETLAIAWLFSAKRARSAARGNTNSLRNCGQLDDFQRQGYRYKRWHTVMDGRERLTHAVANRTVVRIDEPFIIGGYRMMFPRDTTYGAPMREIANCRCQITGE